MPKKVNLFFLLLASSLLLAGCTGANKEEGDPGSKLENVTVVENGNDNEEEGDESDVEDVTPDPAVEEEIEEKEEIKDPVVTDGTEDGGVISVGNATSTEGAVVSAYSYEVAGNTFMFEWKVGSEGANKFPKATAKQNEDGTVVVTFPSLTRDSVAKEEKTMELGGLLPELMWKPEGSGSVYQFMYESKKSINLKTVDRGEDGLFIILEVS